MATASVFTVHGLRKMCRDAGFGGFKATRITPPFQHFPYLRFLSKILEKTPLRFFGATICSVAIKN
jgi:hypothetical protein